MNASSDATIRRQRQYALHERTGWRRLATYESVLVLVLIAFFLVAALTVPYFDSRLTTIYLLQDATPVLIVALPMTMVIILGEIDLSVASVAGLSSVVCGELFHSGWSFPLAALVALLVGIACGLFNGFMIAYVGLPSLAMTIATMALFRGIAVGLLGINTVSGFPAEWTGEAQGAIGGSYVPNVALLLIVLSLVASFVLHRMLFGRNLFDIGRSSEASRFAGINARRIKLATFVATALFASLAGMYDTLRYDSVRSDNDTGLELLVIAAIVLGGVSIFGGRGKMLGVIASVLLIGTVSSALRLENVNANTINVIIGILLIVSVMLPRLSGVAARRFRRNRPEQPVATDSNLPRSNKESAFRS
ncbi:ABC transporter permease [Microbacterium sp. X-17]|uniref:ABC transporter permease n=1 Tax=Microbacterium sp. X-17 TaxID=3144404 RepID=UPI0031F56BF7